MSHLNDIKKIHGIETAAPAKANEPKVSLSFKALAAMVGVTYFKHNGAHVFAGPPGLVSDVVKTIKRNTKGFDVYKVSSLGRSEVPQAWKTKYGGVGFSMIGNKEVVGAILKGFKATAPASSTVFYLSVDEEDDSPHIVELNNGEYVCRYHVNDDNTGWTKVPAKNDKFMLDPVDWTEGKKYTDLAKAQEIGLARYLKAIKSH